MATAADSDSEADQQDYNSDDFVRCPVCLDYYSVPKLLPCAHIVCSRCLINWLKANARPTTCPLCRASIRDMEVARLPLSATPEEISEVLPTDLSMESLVDANKQLRGPHVCSKCGEEANSFCLDCYKKLCKECRRKHAKATARRASKAAAKREAVLAAEAAGTSTPKSNIPYVAPKKHRIELLALLDQKTISSQRGQMCTKHTAEENSLDYYCETHDASLCLKCVEEEHSECTLVTSQAKLEESRKILREQADLLREREKFLEKEEEILNRREKEVMDMGEELNTEIGNVMDGISRRLTEARDKLNQDVLESQNLPPEQRAAHQRDLLRAFKEKLSSIVSLHEASAAMQRYTENSREAVNDIQKRTEALRRNGGPRVQRQRVYHHHHPGHHRHHHHNPQQHSQPVLDTSEMEEAFTELNSAVQVATNSLERTILSVSPSTDSTDPPSTDQDRSGGTD